MKAAIRAVNQAGLPRRDAVASAADLPSAVNSAEASAGLAKSAYIPPKEAQVITQYFYVSQCLAAPGELDTILERARFHNERRSVTGALLFTGGHFAQLLEGSAEALAETIGAISADPRHTAMTRVSEGPAPTRRFADWSMAFMSAPGADDLIAELLANPARTTPERAQRLLELMFRGS